MDSDDLEYHERAPPKPFRLSFPTSSSSTPRTGRASAAPRKSHPSIFAPRSSKPAATVFAMQTPTHSSLQSPPRDDFYRRQSDSITSENKEPIFQIFPQGAKPAPTSTLSRHSSSAVRQSPRRSLSRQSSAQPESMADEGNLEDVIRKMREAALIKSQLAEERTNSLNLRAELSNAHNTHLAFQQRISVLESENDRQAASAKSTSEEVAQLKQQLSQATEEMNRTGGIVQDKDVEMGQLRAELDTTRDKLRASEERILKVKEISHKAISGLARNYDELKGNLTQLKLRFDVSDNSLQQTKDEILILRSNSEHQLKVVETHFDDTGRYLFKSAETRDLIAELQQDRHSGQQVIDMLRDKLQALGSQLIESQQKVSDLELRHSEDMARWDRRNDSLHQMETKVEELADKLTKRENESFDILFESANISSAKREADTRVIELQTNLDDRERELASLQQQVSSMESARVQEVEEKLREITSKLNASNTKAHKQELQIAALQEKAQGSSERIMELSESCDQARRTISCLELDVQEAKLACAAETDKCKQVQEKLSMLQPDFVKLKKEVTEGQNGLKDKDVRFGILQERFDSQTMTLKLAKEQSGDLQERLLRCETTYATKLESVAGASKTQIALLEEQKTALETALEQRNILVTTLEESISSSRVIIAQYEARITSLEEQCALVERTLKTQASEWDSRYKEQKAQFDKMLKDNKATFDAATKNLQEQKTTLDKTIKTLHNDAKTHQSELSKLKLEQARTEERTEQRIKLEVEKVDAAQKDVTQAKLLAQDAQRQLQETKAHLDDYKTRLLNATGETLKSTEALEAANTHAKGLLAELDALRDRERTMASRYQSGSMSDTEKTFVQSLIHMTQSMYEQDVVNKENDIRSRDNMITSLRTKINSLESTLAKCLKKQVDDGGQSKSMVDLNLWMSSPLTNYPDNTDAGPSHCKPPTKAKYIEDDISEDDDDDDDDFKPLSDDPILPATTLGKRERPSSPIKHDDSARPTRRTKSVAPKKMVEKKVDAASKAKLKKRR